MSQSVFPSVLQGMDIKVDREPIDAVHVDEAESGKETRWTGSTYPRYRYTIDFNILRADSTLAALARQREWQQFCSHVARHFGKLDSFLWTDPDDSSVTDMGFAAADGVAAAFQLQRTLAGDVIDAAGNSYHPQTKPYLNLLFNSSFEASSGGVATSWAVYNPSSSTEPTFLSIVPGMNGGNAQRVSWGTNNTLKKGLTQSVTFVTGQWYTISFFVRASGSNVGQAMLLDWTSGPSTMTQIANPGLTTGWQRYVWQFIWNPGATVSTGVFPTIAGVSNTFGDLDFDEAQVVKGQHGVNDFQPIPGGTPAAATATRTPTYWPGYADGFEPVFDLNGDVTIYEDGTWRGRRTLYPWVRTNLLPWSQAFDNAAWTKTNATMTAAATTAPDGTTTGESFNEGTANAIHSVVENTSPAEVQGELRCYSAFLKANNLPNVSLITQGSGYLNFNLGTGIIVSSDASVQASGVQTSPLWPGWYRVWFVRRVPVTLMTGFGLQSQSDGTYSGNPYTGTSRTFYAWGAMCERVSNLNGPTPYIPTPSSTAVTVTDYALSSSGLFTPAAVPVAGTFYSWDGSYYRRVRMDMASVPTSRLVQFMYEAKRILLISTKP
jgi:hypothetical protein